MSRSAWEWSVLALAVALPAAAQIPAPAQGAEPASDPAAGAGDVSGQRAPSPPDARGGFTGGLRVGWGIPSGDLGRTASGTMPLRGEFSGQLVAQVEAGYQFPSRYVVGGYLSLDFPFLVEHGSGVVAQECHAPGVHACAGGPYGFRAGVYGSVNLDPVGALEPWLGVGTGLEVLEYVLFDDRDIERGWIWYYGWEIVNLQAGVEWRVKRHWTVGPYASIAVGQYLGIAATGDLGVPVTISDGKIHGWAQLGVKFTMRSR